jgi:CDP-glucose 4,6-dehydratase
LTAEGDCRGRSVLVTGGQGFVGSWLVERLLEEGARVVVLRRDAPVLARFSLEGLEDRCEVALGDLVSYTDSLRTLQEYSVEVVFHLAAQTLVGTARHSPLSTWESNIRGTYNLLEACRAVVAFGQPLRAVVVASSDKAYGTNHQLPYREDFPLNARYPYDVSKACTDLVARSYASTYHLPVAVTRLANVYGGGDLNVSRIVPDTARALVAGERPVLRSDGSPERDYLYVADAVDAYLAVRRSLERPEMWGRAWNVGAGEPIRVIDLVRLMISISGKEIEPDIQGAGVPAGEIDRQYLDSSAIREELGWQPTWDLQDGLDEAWSWYERMLPQR